MVWRVILVSVPVALIVFAVFFHVQARGESLAYVRTLAVDLIVVLEVFYLFSVRYLYLTALTWPGALGTRAVLTGLAATVALQTAFTYLPLLQRLFDTRPVSIADGALIVGIGALLLLVLEAEKWLRRAFARR